MKNVKFQNGEDKDQSSTYTNQSTPVEGGTLNLFCTNPDTLNPLLTNNIYIKEYTPLIFESLVSINRNQKPVPNLAEKWEVSDDNLKWTFYIYEDIIWQDGSPFTADDIEFTVSVIKDPYIVTPYEKNVENIESVRIIDSRTIEFTLYSPSAFTPYMMTFPIISKNYFSGEDLFTTDKNLNPMGTGPYMFSSYQPGTSIQLVRNDNWWKASPEREYSENLPYINEVTIKIFESPQQEFDAFQAGAIDIIMMEKGEAAKYGMRSDLKIQKYPGNYFEYLSFNTNDTILREKGVRQAIAYALDRNKIINEIIPGEALVADLPLIPDTVFYRSNVAIFPPSKQKARDMLIQEGWEDIDGIMHKYINGAYMPLSLELIVNDDNDTRCRVADKIAKELHSIGMEVEVVKLSWDEVMDRIENSTYCIAFLGCKIPAVPDISFLYSSSYYPQYSVSGIAAKNTSGYINEEVDNYLEQVLVSRDENSMRTAYDKLTRIILDDIPYLGLYFYYDAILYNKRINGNMNPNLWNSLEKYTQWYLDAES
mgnify:CR=1 FL=1